ncbi:MAG: hypothetical protein ABIO96_07330 [Nitrospiraceae bacterium]
MAPGASFLKNDLLLLASLFLLELSIAVMPVAMNLKGERPFAVFLSSRPGMVFLLAIAVLFIAGAVIIGLYQVSKRSSSRHFRLIVTMNLVTVLLMLITGEIAMRILSRSSIEGETLGSRVLIPKNWGQLTLHNRQLLDKAGARPTFHVYDDLMGWTVRPNRRSANGLYYSSLEGIRAPHEGVSFAKLTEKTRIALVGDSYTFGEDVAYEDTWGYLLERALGPEFEVLNFGVPGYGVDQAYLRYEKDVREWKPKVVIFSFISHDVERAMTIYTALNYPEWDMPFSKPRFILRDGDLKKLNVPPLTPEAIFSRGSISELPFLEYDRGYRQSDWRQSFFHLSYLARAFVTWFRPSEAGTPDVSDEALVSVNASILKAFVRSAEQAATAPVVVYHPKRAFAVGPSLPLPLGKRVLQEAGLAYTEPTSCLLELDPADWFIPGGHYTPQGNAAVAKCLLNVVRQALAQTSDG